MTDNHDNTMPVTETPVIETANPSGKDASRPKPGFAQRAFSAAVTVPLYISIVTAAGSGLIAGLMAATNDIEEHGEEITYALRVPTGHKIPLLYFTDVTREQAAQDERNVYTLFGAAALSLPLTYGLYKWGSRKQTQEEAPVKTPPAATPPPPSPPQTPPSL